MLRKKFLKQVEFAVDVGRSGMARLLLPGVAFAFFAVYMLLPGDGLTWITELVSAIRAFTLHLVDASGILKFDKLAFVYILSGAIISFAIEIFLVGYQQSSLCRIIRGENKSARIDLYIWVLMITGGWYFFSIVFTFGICHDLIHYLRANYRMELIHRIDNGLIRFIVLFLISDLVNYLFHRCGHTYRFFWEVHRYHHSATDLNFLTSRRVHFIYVPLVSVFTIPVLIVLGSTIDDLFLINFLQELHQCFQHSQFQWKWGFIGRYLLVSPAVHRAHHSLNQRYFGKNLGSCFIFWDRMFGTYEEPEKNETYRFGLSDDDINDKNLMHGMLHTYVKALKTLVPRTAQKAVD